MKNLIVLTAIVLLPIASACNKTEQASENTAVSQPQQQKKAQNLKGPEARTLLSETEDVVILDVRTPAEFSGGHLQKAVNIDYQSPGFAEELNKLDPDKKYLVYCAAGGRSAKAVALMEEKGFARVYNCEEGYEDLKKSGVPAE